MGFESSSHLALNSCTGSNKDVAQRLFRQKKSGISKEHQARKDGGAANCPSQRLFKKNLKELTDLLVPTSPVTDNSIRSKKNHDSK